jgi:hypothetical protein
MNSERSLPSLVYREPLMKKLLTDLQAGYHPIIIGSRQSGKTTLAYQLNHKLQELTKDKKNTRDKYLSIFVDATPLGSASGKNIVNHFYKAIKDVLSAESKRLGNASLTILNEKSDIHIQFITSALYLSRYIQHMLYSQ